MKELMTSVLEMMENDVDSVIDLTVECNHGSSKPISGKVYNAFVSEDFVLVDDELKMMKIYTITFNGWNYYTVDKFTKLVGA